jgi:DNA-binding Xre family transcriptional regulator
MKKQILKRRKINLKMKVGDNIQKIREKEKDFKRSYVAAKLQITTRAYGNIENNVAEITVNRLIDIAKILECDPMYIINYKYINDHHCKNIHINMGTNDANTAFQKQNNEKIKELYEQLLASQRSRIELLKQTFKEQAF